MSTIKSKLTNDDLERRRRQTLRITAIVSRALLLKATKTAVRVVGNKGDLYLSVNHQSMHISAGGFTTALLKSSIPVISINSPSRVGHLRTNAKNLAHVLSNIPDTQISLDFIPDVNGLIVKGDNHEFTLSKLDTKSPELSSSDIEELMNTNVTLNKGIFATQLKSVMNATSTTGVLIRINSEAVHMVGTDGKRLIVSKTYTKTGISNPVNFVIPNHPLNVLKPFLNGDVMKNVYISWTQTHVHISIQNGISMYIRLIEGNYPDYQSVIAGDVCSDTTITVDKTALIKALATTTLGASKDDQDVMLRTTSANGLSVSSHHKKEMSSALIDAEIQGNRTEISINGCDLSSILRHIDADAVTLHTKGKDNPIFVTPYQTINTRAVLIPVRVH